MILLLNIKFELPLNSLDFKPLQFLISVVFIITVFWYLVEYLHIIIFFVFAESLFHDAGHPGHTRQAR